MTHVAISCRISVQTVCEVWFIHLTLLLLITCSYNQQRIQSSTCTSVLTSPLPIQVRNYWHTHTQTHSQFWPLSCSLARRHETYPVTQTNTTQTESYEHVWESRSVWPTGRIPTSCPRLWLHPCLRTLDSPSSAACSSQRCIHRTLRPHNLTASPPMVSCPPS